MFVYKFITIQRYDKKNLKPNKIIKKMDAYVVTDTEAGWDCVRGVFLTKEGLYEYFEDMGITKEQVDAEDTDTYVIHEKRVIS